VYYLDGSVELSPWELNGKGYQAGNEFMELFLEEMHLLTWF
jgi:hypothetical protein